MTPHCSTCGHEIRDGEGHYDSPDGLFCARCGLPFPLGAAGCGVQVAVNEKYGKEERR